MSLFLGARFKIEIWMGLNEVQKKRCSTERSQNETVHTPLPGLLVSRSTIARTQLVLNEIAGVNARSRPYLLNYGAACHPNVIVQYFFLNKKACENIFLRSRSSCRAAIKRPLKNIVGPPST